MSEDYSNLFAVETPKPAPADSTHPTNIPAAPGHVSLGRWIWEGLRASVFLRPRVSAGAVPGPWQLFFIVGLTALLVLGADWLSFAGDVRFRIDGWFAEWGLTLMVLWCLWCMVPAKQAAGATRGGRALAWLALQSMAAVPLMLLSYVFLGIDARMEEPNEMPLVLYAAFVIVFVVWLLVLEWRLARFTLGGIGRTLCFLLAAGAIATVFISFSDVDVWDSSEVDTEAVQQDGSDGEVDQSPGADSPDHDDSDDGDESDDGILDPSKKLLEAQSGAFDQRHA